MDIYKVCLFVSMSLCLTRDFYQACPMVVGSFQNVSLITPSPQKNKQKKQQQKQQQQQQQNHLPQIPSSHRPKIFT